MEESISDWVIVLNVFESAIFSTLKFVFLTCAFIGVLLWLVIKPIAFVSRRVGLNSLFKSLYERKLIVKLEQYLQVFLTRFLNLFPRRARRPLEAAMFFVPVWLPVFILVVGESKTEFGTGGEIGAVLGMSTSLVYFFSQGFPAMKYTR